MSDIDSTLAVSIKDDNTGYDAEVNSDNELLVSVGSWDENNEVHEYGYNGTNWNESRQDVSTQADLVLQYRDHEIHEGNHFFIKNFVSLNNNQVREFIIITPDSTRLAHFSFIVDVGNVTTVDLYEGVTTTDDGTSVTVFNNDRNSSTTNTTLWYHTPTITTDGTALYNDSLGSVSVVAKTENAGGEFYILKANTKYLFRITSGGNANKVRYSFNWYEHVRRTA